MELHTKNNVADMGTMLSNVCTVTILLTEDHSTLLCAATILNYGKKNRGDQFHLTRMNSAFAKTIMCNCTLCA